MTPHKIDSGRQPHKEQETQWAVSQKCRSQSWPCDEADPKRGRTEGEGKPRKIQVGIDWSTTGIQKPVSKPDSRPPSSKLDVSGPSVKSSVAKVSQKHASMSQTRTGLEGRLSRTPNAQLGDPEKREIKDKPHGRIESRVKCLDPARRRLTPCVTLGGMPAASPCRLWLSLTGVRNTWMLVLSTLYPCSPSSCSPPYGTHTQVPVKLSQVNTPGGDMCQRSREAWKWMVVVLQFWADEASSADDIVYGGCEHPVSALAEYVLNAINPGLDPRSRITWDDVVIRTPWMAKWLHGMTATQEMMIRCQALPVQGESSELQVVLEKRYSEQLLHSKGRGKLVAENPTIPGHKPVTSSGLTKAG